MSKDYAKPMKTRRSVTLSWSGLVLLLLFGLFLGLAGTSYIFVKWSPKISLGTKTVSIPVMKTEIVKKGPSRASEIRWFCVDHGCRRGRRYLALYVS